MVIEKVHPHKVVYHGDTRTLIIGLSFQGHAVPGTLLPNKIAILNSIFIKKCHVFS